LVKGENMALPADSVRLQVLLGWRDGDGQVDVDAAALLLGSDRRVLSDDDFVFYNQPDSPDGAVRHQGQAATEAGSEERLSIDLEAARDEVALVAVTASIYRGTFGDVESLRLLVLDAASELVAEFTVETATLETALVVAEIYRHGDGWKLRAVGQGWESGLAALVSEFGVTVDAEDAAADGDRAPADVAVGATPPAAPVHGHVVAAHAEDTADAVDDLVEVVQVEESGGLADVIPLPNRRTDAGPVEGQPGAAAAGQEPQRRSGVRTRKTLSKAVPAPALQLAGAHGWQPARVFSIAGVGPAEEQEKRATSALMAMMMAVRPFGRALASRFGAPAGIVETYLEVPFPLGESTVQPDGVIRVARAGRIWTGLLETKTGSGQLRRDQVEHYLDVARDQGFDAVITLSNEIAPAAGEHPVAVDGRKLRKVALHHVSWAEILHEAKMTLVYRGAGDPLQAWLLAELIRYLEHPRSGASGFEDMGAAWVTVREAVAAGTLRASDRKVPAVADAWTRLVRHLCLRLSADLGVKVAHILPRRLAADPAARVQAVVAGLVSAGTLDAVLRVPDAAGPITVTADVRTTHVRVTVEVRRSAGGHQRSARHLVAQAAQGRPGRPRHRGRFPGSRRDDLRTPQGRPGQPRRAPRRPNRRSGLVPGDALDPDGDEAFRRPRRLRPQRHQRPGDVLRRRRTTPASVDATRTEDVPRDRGRRRRHPPSRHRGNIRGSCPHSCRHQRLKHRAWQPHLA
jgi:stress response protein SCP2